MTETNNNVDWSNLRDAGLFREGIHYDTQVIARTPEGKAVEIEVFPIHVDGETNTLFAPIPEEAKKMSEIIPKNPRSFL